MSMKYFFSDLSRVSWRPSGKCLDLYAAHLREQGYAKSTACRKLRVVARYSAWLEKRGMEPKEASMRDVQRYLSRRNLQSRFLRKDDIFTIKQFMHFAHKESLVVNR